MKQLLKVAALALCSISLMSSCCKKKGDEPVPTPTPTPVPTPTPNPVDNTKGITLTLAAGQTAFSVSGLDGENITLEGVSGDKNVTPWKYADKKKNDYTATANTVVVKGNVKELTLSAGQFEKLDLSKAPATLTTLRVLDGTTVKALDLSGAKALQLLSLDNVGLAGDYDLSQYTTLVSVYLKKISAKFTLPLTVAILTLNESHSALKNALDLSTFPNMQRLYLIGSAVHKSVNFAGSTKLTTFGNSRSATPTINLSNCPALKNVLLRDMNGTTEVNLSGCKELVEGKVTSVTSFTGFCTNDNSRQLKTLNLAGASLTNFDDKVCTIIPIVNLDLSGNKLTKANFSKLTSLKELNLLNNGTLTGAELTNALQSLPATQGKIKIANLSASDAAIVAAKGWTVAQ